MHVHIYRTTNLLNGSENLQHNSCVNCRAVLYGMKRRVWVTKWNGAYGFYNGYYIFEFVIGVCSSSYSNSSSAGNIYIIDLLQCILDQVVLMMLIAEQSSLQDFTLETLVSCNDRPNKEWMHVMKFFICCSKNKI